MNTVKCSNRFCEKEYSVEHDNCPFCGAKNPMEESERKKLIEKDHMGDIGNKNDDSNQFHGVIVGWIWICIFFFGIRGIMTSFANMVFEPAIGCLTLGVTIIGLVSLIYILRAKTWALFLWMAYRLSAGIINGFISSKYDFATNIFIAIANIGLMVLILQIKKDGVSAWSIFFNKKKHPDKAIEMVADVNIIEETIEDKTSQSEKDDKNAAKNLNTTNELSETQGFVDEDTAADIDSFHPIEAVQEEVSQAPVPSNEQAIENNATKDVADSERLPQKNLNIKGRRSKIRNGKWWIYPLAVIAVLAIAGVTIWLFHRTGEPKLGKYVYVDNYSILHLDRNCDNIAVFHGAKPVLIYPLNELTANNWDQTCSNCIDEKKYEKLNTLMIGNKNRYWLYNTLVKEGHNMGDYSEFSRYIRTQEGSKWCYDELKLDGYSIPEYETYIIQMGLDSIHPATGVFPYCKITHYN